MRCPRCGNENPGSNRFCGMCGTSLLAPASVAAQPQPVPVAAQAPSVPETVAHPEPPRAPAPPRSEAPSISGPSFLGLNDPAPPSEERKRASLSIDPNSSSGSNLDYLLEDEEQPRHWGPGKILLILIALALAVGFGYLRWKGQGLSALNPPKKPAATVPESTASDPNAPAPNLHISDPPADAGATQTPSDVATPATTTPSASTPKPSAPAADASKSTDAPAATAPDKSDSPSSSDPAAPPKAVPEQPKVAPKEAAPKPPAARSADPVAEAQKYLYGRGVAQDCERGMRLLKPAANASNPKAMIEMGALYSAGLCTPHDLPTAYRWFALALRKDPNNTAVQADLQKLWGEMTQPERQLAIRMSQ